MNPSTEASSVPRIVDPGADGWAEEPKVTNAELLLYGHRAGIVRLLGQAAVALGDAYSLACKYETEALAEEPSREAREIVEAIWPQYEEQRKLHSMIASRSIELRERTREDDYGTEPRPGDGFEID